MRMNDSIAQHDAQAIKDLDNKHLMVVAGGTGGHVFPALAVANALRQKQTRITWLGTRKGLEATVIPANNIDMHWISIEGLRGKGVLSWLVAPIKILRAIAQSIQAIRNARPDCVLGMGGFVAGPGGLAARLLGKSLIVHEQNAVAGLTNRYLAKIANQVLCGFPNTLGLPASAKWVGNPVRNSIKVSTSNRDEQTINVLVIGGSQGAHSFNQYLPQILSSEQAAISIWHQTGKGKSAAVKDKYQSLTVEAKVTDFIDDMAAAYEWADLLVCRAGAMTIAECCAAAKPALLVPYPYSAGDHQMKNAEAMSSIKAAIIVQNERLQNASSLTELTQLLSNKTELQAMGQRALQLHKPSALTDVVQVCEEYLNA